MGRPDCKKGVLLFLPLFFAHPRLVCAESGHQSSLLIISQMLSDILRAGTESGAEAILSGIASGESSVFATIRLLCEGPFLSLSFSLLSLTFIVALTDAGFSLSASSRDYLRPFLGFAAALVLVRETPRIILAGLQSLCALSSLFARPDAPAQTGALHSALMDLIRPRVSGFFSGFSVILELFLPWLFSILLSFLIRVIAFGLLAEIFVRAALLPLSYGDLILNGLNGQGFRFLKKFAAALLSLILCLIICRITSQLSAAAFLLPDDLPHFLQGVLMMLIAQGSGALLMGKSQRTVQEALGV